MAPPRNSVGVAATGFTRAEKLQVIGDVSNGLAAVAALFTTFIALRALLAQVSALARERRSAYYRATVLQPAMDELPAFQKSAHQFLQDGEQKLRAMLQQEASHSAVLSETRKIATGYKDLFRPINNRLLSSAAIWEDESLVSDLNSALELLQDGPTLPLNAMVTGAGISRPLGEEVYDGVARVLGVIVHHDLKLEPSKPSWLLSMLPGRRRTEGSATNSTCLILPTGAKELRTPPHT